VATKNILIIVTWVIFFAFFSNVVAGAAGVGVFLSDVGEMLTLFAACVCFVIAFLAYERAATDTQSQSENEETKGGGTLP
jgi:hypothetical protein